MKAQISGNEFKLVLVSIYISDLYGNSSKLAAFDYNLVTEECSLTYNNFSNNQLTERSGEFPLLTPTGVSLLHNLSLGLYHSYQQHLIPFQSGVQPLVHPYEICKNYIYKINRLQSFPWQGNNHVLMSHYSTMLEADSNVNGALEPVTFLSPRATFYQFHELSPDNYLLHYAYFGYRYLNQRVKLYKEDGTTDTSALETGFSEWYSFASLSDVTDGNGWFVYEDDEYNFHRIENNILQDEFSQPLLSSDPRRLVAIQGNYLIVRYGYEFRILKIDNDGSVASGWQLAGETFTSHHDPSQQNAQLHTYQNRLIFSYLVGDIYKLHLIDPLNLDETITYSFPSSYDAFKKEFIIGNRFYFIHNYNNNLTMHCFDIENDFALVWMKVIADNVIGNFAIKKLDNRFVIAYPQGESGSEKIYLRTISFIGNSDQYEDGYALPLNMERQYAPAISIVDNNTIYVNRIENNSLENSGVYTDLIDLSYFVPNSSEDVLPATMQTSNYPNPFNPETTITFAIPKTGQVNIDVYNIKGQKVKTLVNEHRTAGQHSVVWNGTDDNNKPLSSGVYLYKMRNGKSRVTRKMILMK